MNEIESMRTRLEARVAARDMRGAEKAAVALWKAVRDASIDDLPRRHRTAVTLVTVAEVFRLRFNDSHGATLALRRAFEWADATPYDPQRPSYREEIANRLGTEFEQAKCHRSAAHWFRQALELARLRPVPDHVMRNLKGVAWNLQALEAMPGSESPAPYYDELLKLGWPQADPGRLEAQLWMTNCAAMYLLDHGDEARGLEVLKAQIALVPGGGHELGDWFGVSIYGVGLHWLATGQPELAIALADSMAGHEARFGTGDTTWFRNRMHGLKARAFVLQQRFDEALEEIGQVFDIDADENVRFAGLSLEDTELWLEVARIRVHLREYRSAAVAYQFAAWAYGERSADDVRARTARARMVWIERQAAVVHELASVWIDLKDGPDAVQVQRQLANALMQLKTNLYLSTAGNRLVVFRDDPGFMHRLLSANRRFAAAARQSLARPDDLQAAMHAEDMLFLREQVEGLMVAGGFEMLPALAEIFHFDFAQWHGDGTLIDYSLVDYRPPKLGQAGRPQGRRYVGVKLVKQAIQLVDLGPADSLDADADAFTRACASRPAEKAAADRHLGRHDAALATAGPLELGRRLYDRLLAPFGAIEGRLVASPDGPLAAVPFHALMPQDDQFLIEQRDVSVCHSVLNQAAIDSRQRTPGMRISEGVAMVVPDVVLLGDPDYTDIGLEPLAGTRDEVDRIAELFLATDWIPSDAVHRCLERSADFSHATGTLHPHVLHIAAHGTYAQCDQVPRDRDLVDQRLNWRRTEDSGAYALSRFDAALLGAFLTLSLDPNREGGELEDIDRRRLTALELSSLNLIASRLVVLSACETGLGYSERGAGVLGFQYALAASFATNALVSLWRVPDRETADLMIGLYRRMLAERPSGSTSPIVRCAYAEALRAACRTDGKAVHPYYWAAFVYCGAR